MSERAAPSVGRVYLVGGGPGDPGLLTLRGKECLERADVVVYDRLVHPTLLDHAPERAERVYAGKEADAHLLPQAEINALLVARARAGQVVVRLKGGDPFVFGRGGEEAEALAQAGVPFEVVSGVSSAIGVPAYAGIPLTHRDLSSGFTVVTGHEDPDKAESLLDWEKLAGAGTTLVLLMAASKLDRIARRLVRHGLAPTTPAAVIEWGTWPRQRTVQTTLAEAARAASEAGIGAPATVVVGPVVGLRERLRWFDRRPLFGRRVLVTRTREQAGTLAALLRERGAEPIELPTIRVVPPEDWGQVDDAIRRLAEFDWVIFTSANGARFFFERLEALGLDARAFARARLATIGPATAAALAHYHLKADFVPTEYVAEAVVEEMARFDLAGQRVLLPRAREAREVLAAGLAARGALVDEVAVYETRPAGDPEAARALLASRQVEVVTLTSSSTARNLVRLLGEDDRDLLRGVVVASIGPITSQTARELGLAVEIEAAEHTVPGLVDALENYFGKDWW